MHQAQPSGDLGTTYCSFFCIRTAYPLGVSDDGGIININRAAATRHVRRQGSGSSLVAILLMVLLNSRGGGGGGWLQHLGLMGNHVHHKFRCNIIYHLDNIYSQLPPYHHNTVVWIYYCPGSG